MLISRLDIDVGRPVQCRVLAQDGFMTHAGVNPDIERVAPAPIDFRQTELVCKFNVAEFVPSIGAAALDEIRQFANPFRVQDRIGSVVKDRQRYAPTALSRNAPVGSGLDGSVDPVSAPMRNAFDLIDRFKGGGFQYVDFNEKLFDRSEDYRSL